MPDRAPQAPLAALLAAALASFGCGTEAPADPAASAPPTPPRVRLHVAAASDLQRALPGLVQVYRREHPDVEVVTTLGASGQLAEQVKAGAPFALFLAANEGYIKTLVADGSIVAGSARPYARGRLVIVTDRNAKAPPKGVADLARPDFRRIAIANPETAPFGAAARQALKKAGVWSKVRLQLVFADSVRQALQFVENGGAEAGLVSRSLVDPDRLQVVEVDPADHDPIIQWLGVAARVPEAERAEADRFAAFVVGETGGGLLRSFGLEPAGATTTAEPGQAAPPTPAGPAGAR